MWKHLSDCWTLCENVWSQEIIKQKTPGIIFTNWSLYIAVTLATCLLSHSGLVSEPFHSSLLLSRQDCRSGKNPSTLLLGMQNPEPAIENANLLFFLKIYDNWIILSQPTSQAKHPREIHMLFLNLRLFCLSKCTILILQIWTHVISRLLDHL